MDTMNPRLMMLMIGAALVSACTEPGSLDGRCEALFGGDARAPARSSSGPAVPGSATSDRKAPDRPGRPRLLVLTDIGNEPDDSQSLVRLLVYASEFDIEGILATTSAWLRDQVHGEIIQGHVSAYGEVRDNLLVHAPGYPTAEQLQARVAPCLPAYGLEGVGEGMDSKGSEFILRVLEAPDDRPLWITIWGGANCLAQALWKLEQSRSPIEVDRLVSKLRIYAISDQDDSSQCLRGAFPELSYIVSPSDEGYQDYRTATWWGISGDDLASNLPKAAFCRPLEAMGRRCTRIIRGPRFEIVDNPWLAEHIRSHGPLGARYPAVRYIMEGDTPSFLNLIGNGLAAHLSPDWGGWGGRYELLRPEGEPREIWTNADDEVLAPDGVTYRTNHATVWRWREAFQHDFAARMDWSISERFADANHNPILIVNGDGSKEPIEIRARPGESVHLSASGSRDPDPDDRIRYRWWQYREAGSHPSRLSTPAPEAEALDVLVPGDAAGSTLHIILEAADDGAPSLTSYRRIIIDATPPVAR
jgi:hypothetical protein